MAEYISDEFEYFCSWLEENCHGMDSEDSEDDECGNYQEVVDIYNKYKHKEVLVYININGGEYFAGTKKICIKFLNKLFHKLLDHERCSIAAYDLVNNVNLPVTLTF